MNNCGTPDALTGPPLSVNRHVRGKRVGLYPARKLLKGDKMYVNVFDTMKLIYFRGYVMSPIVRC